MPGYAKPPSYNANNISITPAGNISSTTLQAGLEEIDSEKTTENYVDTTVNTATAAVPTGRKNLLYNGAMQVAQRGTSTTGITGNGYFTADRWAFSVGGPLGTWTQSLENDAPAGSGFRKSIKLLCTTADATPAASDTCQLYQILEGQDVQRLKKGTASAEAMTVSFWVKSNVTGTFIVYLYDSNNVRSISAAYTVNASATWEKKTVTFAGDTSGVLNNDNAASFGLYFTLAMGSNRTSGTLQTSWGSYVAADNAVGQTNLAAATNNYWQITGVQLEVGDTATDFEHKPYGVELAECQRYYEVTDTASTNIYSVGGASSVSYLERFQVVKRDSPTITYIGGSAGVSVGSSSVYGAVISRSSTSLYTGVTASAEL